MELFNKTVELSKKVCTIASLVLLSVLLLDEKKEKKKKRELDYKYMPVVAFLIRALTQIQTYGMFSVWCTDPVRAQTGQEVD